jgi:FMN phosphatase YigB (HAD superfamily)
MKIIFDYNRTLFNPDAGEVFPGVFHLLKTLSQKHELFLITLNKPERKDSSAIQDMKAYFDEILFVERKTVETFRKIVGDDKNVIVIGDRFEDEIRIGIELELITVHIQPTKAFYKKNQTPTHVVSEITNVLQIIDRYEE